MLCAVTEKIKNDELGLLSQQNVSIKEKSPGKEKVFFKTSSAFVRNMLRTARHSIFTSIPQDLSNTKQLRRKRQSYPNIKRGREQKGPGGYSKIGCIFEYLNSNRSQPYANLPS